MHTQYIPHSGCGIQPLYLEAPIESILYASMHIKLHCYNIMLVRFQDYHTVNHSKPLLDASQDWYLLLGQEDDTWTILKFVRQIDTCDSSGDIIIQVSVNCLCTCTTMCSRVNLLKESVSIVIHSRHFNAMRNDAGGMGGGGCSS